MQHFRFGDVTVTRIEELSGPLFDPARFFPDYRADAFAAAQHWLLPHHLHPNGRLLSSIHSWLLRTPRHNVLVDACIGADKDRMPFRDWHQMQSPWLANLRAAGVAPADIDYVLCTHLHVDHVGWNTRLENGRWVPTFPNARYLFARSEYAHWQQERAHDGQRGFEVVARKVYDDSVLPIVAAGRADLVDGRHALLDGLLTLAPAPGHTPGSIAIELATRARSGLFTGDILHHPIQVVHVDWNSDFCALPEQARATRRAVLEHCCEHGALLLPAHFGYPHAAHIEARSGGFEPVFVAPDAAST